MYFPYLRGRQFELLALRELIKMDLLSKHILPIVEPVKGSSTLVSTVQTFTTAERELGIVVNPQVGTFNMDLRNEKNKPTKDNLYELMKDTHIVRFFCANAQLPMYIEKLKEKKIAINQVGAICSSPDNISYYEEAFLTAHPRFSFIPDESAFRRRIRNNRVLFADRFGKQSRNTDYSENEDEVFSSDHLFCYEDGYVGFSDYSVIGKEFSDSGFAPYAIAIHIVYFDDDKTLRVRHFVSDTNDDITDPAGKFEEAVGKLVEWNKHKKLSTFGIRAFEDAYKERRYPGLGVVKKYSVMHHLEMIGEYLDDVGAE